MELERAAILARHDGIDCAETPPYSGEGEHIVVGRSAMSKRMFLGVVCAATALNVGILIANLSSSSIAGVAGMDQQALTRDQDFVWAVQSIV